MKFIPNAVSLKAGRALLQTQKASPQILFAAGVIGLGATVVLACRATLHLEDVLDEHEKGLAEIGELYSEVSVIHDSTESVQLALRNVKKDKAYLYGRTTRQLTVLYGPAVLTGTLSVICLTGAHNILNRRNAALAAAYGTLERAFDGYRERVRENYGEEREKEIYHDVLPCEIDDPETGKKSKRKIASGAAPYSFLFTPLNPNYETTPEYNFLFLKSQQKWANDRLQARGHLFLNEVLHDLGFENTPAGAVTGWIRGSGDNCVDFGIFNEAMEQRVIDFMVGREQEIWLNFNVDGVIYNKI